MLTDVVVGCRGSLLLIVCWNRITYNCYYFVVDCLCCLSTCSLRDWCGLPAVLILGCFFVCSLLIDLDFIVVF